VLKLHGQMMLLDGLPTTESHSVLDGVLQLPSVAWPVESAKATHRLWREAQREPLFSADKGQKVSRQGGDLDGSFSQGGHVDGDHPEAIIKILSKASLLDGLREIHIGSGDEACAQGLSLVGAQGDEEPLLHHPQELYLESLGHISDLIQKEGPSPSQGEAALTILESPGESSTLMTEKFTLE